MSERKRLVIGSLTILVGVVVSILASVAVHMSQAPEVDVFGNARYAFMPRTWIVGTLFQVIALGGVLLAMAGATFGFIHKRPLTWARAVFGAVLFSALMVILFAVIPNQFLTLAQSTLEWTPQKVFVTIPRVLVLNNTVQISYAALKDMISAGYVTTMLIVIAIVMYQIQERAKREVDVPPPTPVSDYGRPMRLER